MKQLQFVILLFISFCTSCVEEIELQSETPESFESIIVIEATITNELIQQEILLSRAFALDSSGPAPESNANVKVVDDAQNEYTFLETEPGTYISASKFSAQPNRSYSLQVITNDGKSYGSLPTQLTQTTHIDDVVAERGFNEDGDEGVSIFVNSFDPTGNSKFYRYTYEETYKVVAPYYSPFELIINNDNFPYPPNRLERLEGMEIVNFFVLKQPRVEQEQVCYNTVKSNEIIIENTNLFEEDRISKLRVRFIIRNNFILSYRYSILVKQHIQTSEAHTFYKILKQFSESESLFSQTQPGLISGNVFSESNSSEKVLGFFEVSSVNSKRVYFNYKDLFPDEILPPFYILDCVDFFSPDLFRTDPSTGAIVGSPLQEAIIRGDKMFDENLINGEITVGTPYKMVFTACGDCTVLGSNVVPDFWVE